MLDWRLLPRLSLLLLWWSMGALLEGSSPCRLGGTKTSTPWWPGPFGGGGGIAEEDAGPTTGIGARWGRLRRGARQRVHRDERAGLVEQRGAEAKQLGQAILRLLLGGGCWLTGRRAPCAADLGSSSAVGVHWRTTTQIGLGRCLCQAWKRHCTRVRDPWPTRLTCSSSRPWLPKLACLLWLWLLLLLPLLLSRRPHWPGRPWGSLGLKLGLWLRFGLLRLGLGHRMRLLLLLLRGVG